MCIAAGTELDRNWARSRYPRSCWAPHAFIAICLGMVAAAAMNRNPAVVCSKLVEYRVRSKESTSRAQQCIFDC